MRLDLNCARPRRPAIQSFRALRTCQAGDDCIGMCRNYRSSDDQIERSRAAPAVRRYAR
jgi:hypothetical protein